MAYERYRDDDFPAYVPVATRRANGRRQAEKLTKKRGRALEPVTIDGKQIASTFWGKAWCKQLEAHSDYANRLPRGRTYVKNGSVVDLHISAGRVDAYVAGSSLYTVSIELTRLSAPRWQKIIAACAGRIGSLIGLLQGKLSADVLAVLTDLKSGLFPAPNELKPRCSCPDGAYLCKHLAAVLYGVGARLDHFPELFFVLRQVDQAELLASANVANVLATAGAKTSTNSAKKRIAPSAVASLFGIELDEQPEPRAPRQPQLPAPAPAPAATEQAASKQAATRGVRTKAPAPGKKPAGTRDPARSKGSTAGKARTVHKARRD